MTTERKITEKEMYGFIKELALGSEHEIDPNEIIAFCDKKVAALERKAAKAKETAAKKKAASDELTELAAAALSDEFEVVADITARIDYPEVSPQKVVYRLNKLAADGQIEKGEVSVGGGDGKARKLVAFRKLQG